MYKIARDDSQIDAVLNEASRLTSAGENPFWGQTYAEGVEAALRWVFGEGGDEPPLGEVEPVAKKKRKS